MDRLFYSLGAVFLVIGAGAYDWRAGVVVAALGMLAVGFVLDFGAEDKKG